jgi:hypothetical protein
MIKFIKTINIENFVCSSGHRFDVYWLNPTQIGLESLVIQPKDLQGDLLFCKVIQSLFFINHFPPLLLVILQGL